MQEATTTDSRDRPLNNTHIRSSDVVNKEICETLKMIKKAKKENWMLSKLVDHYKYITDVLNIQYSLFGDQSDNFDAMTLIVEQELTRYAEIQK